MATAEEADGIKYARMGLSIAVALYTRRPRVYNLVQGMLGAELWRQGVSHKSVEMLHFLGLSKVVDANRHSIDRLVNTSKEVAIRWKKEAEVHYDTHK